MGKVLVVTSLMPGPDFLRKPLHLAYIIIVAAALFQFPEVQHHSGFCYELLTVSSLQMECICVPNMTAVKVRKRRASRQRKIRSMTATGGEKSLHSGINKKMSLEHLILKIRAEI